MKVVLSLLLFGATAMQNYYVVGYNCFYRNSAVSGIGCATNHQQSFGGSWGPVQVGIDGLCSNNETISTFSGLSAINCAYGFIMTSQGETAYSNGIDGVRSISDQWMSAPPYAYTFWDNRRNCIGQTESDSDAPGIC